MIKKQVESLNSKDILLLKKDKLDKPNLLHITMYQIPVYSMILALLHCQVLNRTYWQVVD